MNKRCRLKIHLLVYHPDYGVPQKIWIITGPDPADTHVSWICSNGGDVHTVAIGYRLLDIHLPVRHEVTPDIFVGILTV